MSTDVREGRRHQERARSVEAAGYVRPARVEPGDSHEMVRLAEFLAAWPVATERLVLGAAVALVLFGAWVLWASGVLS